VIKTRTRNASNSSTNTTLFNKQSNRKSNKTSNSLRKNGLRCKRFKRRICKERRKRASSVKPTTFWRFQAPRASTVWAARTSNKTRNLRMCSYGHPAFMSAIHHCLKRVPATNRSKCCKLSSNRRPMRAFCEMIKSEINRKINAGKEVLRSLSMHLHLKN
jgi:hypothetical protein